MKSLRQFLRGFATDESGATAIEYGLLAALIAVVIIAGATLLGTNLNALFTRVAACLTDSTSAGCTGG